jgi:hypothetical protein
MGWELDGIAHSFGLLALHATYTDQSESTPVHDWPFHQLSEFSKWDAVCSNSIVKAEGYRYYDSLAFIDQIFGLYNFRDHQAIIHPSIEPAEILYSCFGGITIYRKKVCCVDYFFCAVLT